MAKVKYILFKLKNIYLHIIYRFHVKNQRIKKLANLWQNRNEKIKQKIRWVQKLMVGIKK